LNRTWKWQNRSEGCVNRYKLIVFVLSVTFSSPAEASKHQVFQLASLAEVHWFMCGEVVLMTLLCGIGTVIGPISAQPIL